MTLWPVRQLFPPQYKSVSNEMHFRPCLHRPQPCGLVCEINNKKRWHIMMLTMWALKRSKLRKAMQAFLDRNLLLLVFYVYTSSAVSSPLHSLSCHLQKQFHLNGMHKAGYVVLGGLFQIHFFSTYPDLSLTSEPQQPSCHGWVCRETERRILWICHKCCVVVAQMSWFIL